MKKWVPNFIKNEIAGLRHFLPRHAFFDVFVGRFLHGVLEVLGCLLGAFPGLLKFSREASASKNTKKLEVF